MIRERVTRYGRRVRGALKAAIETEHTPHEIALSFAIGIFITTLPTGGLGIGLFFVFVHLWSWVSKAAIFSSVVVLNPFVKPIVYLASYELGTFLVGTEPIAVFETSALNSLLTIVQRILLGNVLIALLLAALGYVVVYELARTYRRQNVPPAESLIDS